MEREYITKIDCQFVLGLPQIVRCKYCVASRPDPHPERHSQKMVQCRKPGTLTFNELVPLDWYCPDGERRTGDA